VLRPDADGTVKFHRDGYTDVRGRFDYATVSTPEKSPPVRYAVLVLSTTAAPPSRRQPRRSGNGGRVDDRRIPGPDDIYSRSPE
jgi:hypothetical protein